MKFKMLLHSNTTIGNVILIEKFKNIIKDESFHGYQRGILFKDIITVLQNVKYYKNPNYLKFVFEYFLIFKLNNFLILILRFQKTEISKRSQST